MMTERPLAQKDDPEFTCYASLTHKLFHLDLKVLEASKLIKYPEPCAMCYLIQFLFPAAGNVLYHHPGKTLRACTLLLLLQ